VRWLWRMWSAYSATRCCASLCCSPAESASRSVVYTYKSGRASPNVVELKGATAAGASEFAPEGRPSQQMQATTTPVRLHETLDGSHPLAGELEPPRIHSRLRDWMRPLRVFCARVLGYLTNYVVAYVPSFVIRRLWYRRILGICVGHHVGVFLGTYVWTFGRSANRRNGVRIGNNTRINRRCTLDMRCGLVIGDNVSISPEVMILGASHDVNNPTFAAVNHPPIVIEGHAFVGTRGMIFPGVTVGRGAVVVAGSQVSKDVPPMTIVAGTPARPIGMRDPGATAYELGDPLPLFE